MQQNDKNTSLDSQNVNQESFSGKNRKKPGIVPAIQRNPAFGPGNIEYEIAVASGVFILEGCGSEKEEKGEEAACTAKSSEACTRQHTQPRNQSTCCHFNEKHSIEPGIKHSICQPPQAGITKSRIAIATPPRFVQFAKNTITPLITSIANLHLSRQPLQKTS